MSAAWANRWVRVALFSAGIGAFLGFVGAFDTGTSPILFRLVVFTVFGLYAGFLAFGVSRWTARQRWTQAHPLARPGAIVLIMTVSMALSTWGAAPLINAAATPVSQLPTYFGISLVMSAAMTALSFAVFRPARVTHAAPADAPPAKFLSRLPAKLFGAELWAVSAEDHYLRVHTSRGEELILLRLSDAIDELEGLEGAQTHRSWWVARAAIRDVKRGDGRATIILPNGTEAPVSRTHARTLREAGWI